MDESNKENINSGTMDQKARELKSSGTVLIAVGAVGLLAVVLVGFGVIPLNMQGIMKFISTGVMGFLFLVFLISGIGSMKRSKTAAADAVRENEKREEILNWFTSEYSAEKIDEAIRKEAEAEKEQAEAADEEDAVTDETPEDDTGDADEASEDEPEETDEAFEEDTDDTDGSFEDEEFYAEDTEENELYFARTAFMKDKISQRFLELDEALLSDITDRLYNRIFG